MIKSIPYIIKNLRQAITNNHQNTLDQVLRTLPSPPSSVNLNIIPLPIAHITSIEYYNKIVEEYSLKTQHCKVFKQKLIYFSYGNIFHRYGNNPTTDATWLPVAFLFDPNKSIKWINYLFPYDTGAAYKGLYKNREVCKFEKYKIINKDSQESLASKLVYYYFCSNQQYLNGLVDVTHAQKNLAIFKECVLHELLNFLKSDLTKFGVDHRQRVIECQTKNDISLKELLNNLIWIGLPRRERDKFRNLCLNNEISIPKIFIYDEKYARPPKEYTTLLEDAAKEFMTNSYF